MQRGLQERRADHQDPSTIHHLPTNLEARRVVYSLEYTHVTKVYHGSREKSASVNVGSWQLRVHLQLAR